jgi:hypothetical protein
MGTPMMMITPPVMMPAMPAMVTPAVIPMLLDDGNISRTGGAAHRWQRNTERRKRCKCQSDLSHARSPLDAMPQRTSRAGRSDFCSELLFTGCRQSQRSECAICLPHGAVPS